MSFQQIKKDGKNSDTKKNEQLRTDRTWGCKKIYSNTIQPKLKIGRKTDSNEDLQISDSMEEQISKIKGGGQSLDDTTRSFMESRFRYDFSKVKIHTDNVSTRTARSVDALAYTMGNDIVFSDNQYRPNNFEGRRLLAHELTHVVQQNFLLDKKLLRQHEGTSEAGTTNVDSSKPIIFEHNTELGGLDVGNFDFHFKNCSILVWVWIKYKFAEDINQSEQIYFKNRFVNAIHNKWAYSGYSLVGTGSCPCHTIPIEIHVEETKGSSYHKLVDVERKTDLERRPKVIWDMNVNYDDTDLTIAHEFGHVLGLYDEYDGGFLENIMWWHKNRPDDPNALMNEGTELRPRYFDNYRKRIQSDTPSGCEYKISSPPTS